MSSDAVEHARTPPGSANRFRNVYAARPVGDVAPNPDEVMQYAWASIDDIWEIARRTPWMLSPWFVDQIAELGPAVGAYERASDLRDAR